MEVRTPAPVSKTTVGLTHDFRLPEEVNLSERQGVRGRAGAHFKWFEE